MVESPRPLSQQSKKAGEVSAADICSVKLDRLNRLKGMLCCGRPVSKEGLMDEINYFDVRNFEREISFPCDAEHPERVRVQSWIRRRTVCRKLEQNWERMCESVL